MYVNRDHDGYPSVTEYLNNQKIRNKFELCLCVTTIKELGHTENLFSAIT